MLTVMVLMLFFCKKLISTFVYKSLFISTLLGLTLFWFSSIFMYLYNTSRLSRHTRQITRFWRRALGLFWGLEFFLFSMYTYLFMLCPIETEFLAEQCQLFYATDLLRRDYLLTLTIITTLMLVFKFFSKNLHQQTFTSTGMVLIFTGGFLCLFCDEFYQLFLYTNLFWCEYYTFNKLDASWDINTLKKPTLVIYQYFFIIILLKLWHSIFIYTFVFYDFYLNVADVYGRSRTLKYTLTNLSYLYVFALTPTLLPIKYYTHTFWELPYYNFLLTPYIYTNLWIM